MTTHSAPAPFSFNHPAPGQSLSEWLAIRDGKLRELGLRNPLIAPDDMGLLDQHGK